MTERDDGSQAVVAKLVLTGVPGSGKSAILQQVADRYAHSSVRVGDVGGAEVFRTDFFWPDSLPDGRRLRIRLYAVSGSPSYNAVDELLLVGSDGIVFVTSAAPEALARGREALRALVFNAGRTGYDLGSRPIVFQYTRVDQELGFQPEAADEALGVPPGSVARFASGSRAGEDVCQAVEWAVEWIVRELGKTEHPVAS